MSKYLIACGRKKPYSGKKISNSHYIKKHRNKFVSHVLILPWVMTTAWLEVSLAYKLANSLHMWTGSSSVGVVDKLMDSFNFSHQCQKQFVSKFLLFKG